MKKKSFIYYLSHSLKGEIFHYNDYPLGYAPLMRNLSAWVNYAKSYPLTFLFVFVVQPATVIYVLILLLPSLGK